MAIHLQYAGRFHLDRRTEGPTLAGLLLDDFAYQVVICQVLEDSARDGRGEAAGQLVTLGTNVLVEVLRALIHDKRCFGERLLGPGLLLQLAKAFVAGALAQHVVECFAILIAHDLRMAVAASSCWPLVGDLKLVVAVAIETRDRT